MRNSRLTPRTNTFMRKAMGITSKVMIFGILLSLFLFACVGVDTLEEIAHAAQLSGYGDYNSGIAFYRSGTKTNQNVGMNFTTFGTTTVLAGADTGADGNVNNRTGWQHDTKGTDHEVGWYTTFSDSMYWALYNGVVSITAEMELKEHATQNSITSTFHKTKGGTQIGGSTTSSAKSYGDLLDVSQAIAVSNMNLSSGVYSFYTKLSFVTEDTSWLNPGAGKYAKVEPVSNGIKIVMSNIDALNPGNNDSSGRTIKVKDRNAQNVGAGLQYVKIERGHKNASGAWVSDNDWAQYYSAKYEGSSATIGSHTNNTSLISSFSFTNSTKDFQCVVKKAGYYKITGYSHIGQGLNDPFYFEVSGGDLNLFDPLNNSTYTVEGLINDLNAASYTLPQADAEAMFSAGYGTDCFDSWTVASGNATILSNEKYVTFTATDFVDVTLNISWAGYEFGKNASNTALWGSVDNPYLIQTDQHLKNLARIVSGTLVPLNSVVGMGLSPTAEQVVATDITYAKSYFVVDDGFEMSTPLSMIIGSQSKVFAGNFDGNSKTITFSYSNSSANYIGLFANVGADGNIHHLNVSANIVGSYRVGGIAGENAGTISYCTVSGTVTGSQNAGGIVGYNTTGVVDNCTNNATVAVVLSSTYKSNIGGIAGINTKGIIQNCTNNATVDGATIIGGIVGKNESEILSCTNTGEITGTGNCIGGITGRNDDIISRCKNTGTIKGVDFVGGITGNNNQEGSGDGMLKNCINSGAIEGAGSVGGIAGENVSGATIQYCVNMPTGTVSGSSNSNVGLIVGNNNGGINEYIFGFILDDQDDKYKHELIGGNYSSAEDIKGWTFTTDTSKVGVGVLDKGFYVVDNCNFTGTNFENVKPMTTTQKGSSWDDITSMDVTGFYIVGDGMTTANGEYFSMAKADGTFVPNAVIDVQEYVGATTDGTLTFNSIEVNSIDDCFADIILEKLTIQEDVAVDYNPTFDGTDKVVFNVINLPANYTYDKNVVAGGTDTINASATAEGTKVLVEIKANGMTFGLKTYLIHINPINLDNVRILYKGKVSGAEKVSVDINGTSTSVYDVTNPSIFDYNQASTIGGTFYIASKKGEEYVVLYSFTYNAANPNSVTIESLIPVDNGAITASHESEYSITDKRGEGSTTFNGSGNYTGTCIAEYILIGTDFGRLSTADPTDPWGTESNPYVISDWTHLIRLSDIVNGISDPIDSVLGYGNASNVMAEDVFFTPYRDADGIQRCYFLVQGNIDMPDGVAFRPIGGEYLTNAKLDVNDNPVYISYFGGIVDGKYNSQSSVIDLGNTLENYTGDYSGLFGRVKGIDGAYATIKNIKVDATTISGNNYVGSLVGKAEEYVLIDYSDAGTEYVNTANVNGNNYVGGFVGYVGLSVRMLGAFDNSGQVTAEGNYIGGIIGQLVAGAGTKSTGSNTYNFGAGLSLVNNGKVMALVNEADMGNYVGGIIGGTIANTGDYSALETIINVDIMQNFASVSGTNYVGGLIGEVSPSVALHIRNALNNNGLSAGGDDWTHNGSLTSNGDSTISGTADAVGGLVGKLSLMGHQLVGVFNTMPVIGGGQYVGGIVGVMDGGTITNSFVSIPGTDVVTSSTNLVSGGSNVGGLVGMINAGTLTDNFVQGFNFDIVSANRGGVVGVAQVVANINNSWALYITGTKDSVTHKTASANSYGKYVLTYNASTATIGEMLVYAGLIENSTIAGDSAYIEASSDIVTMEKGKVSFGLALPEVGDQGDSKSKDQLTFYDGSGYENPFPDAFDGAANDSTDDAKMLYVRLSKSSSTSLIVAATPANFGTVSDYDSKAAWESAYFNIGEEGLYVAEMYNGLNEDGTGTAITEDGVYKPNYQIKYKYDYATEYVYVSVEITKSYGKETDVAPLIISNLTDWQNFATRVRNGESFFGKYVKLSANIETVDASNLAGRMDGSTAKNFRGTFDGDGYYIKIGVNTSGDGISLFPYSADATFKNLTVTGYIYGTGNNRAGFVGEAKGPLTFENCTNKATLTGTGYSIGGFIGITRLGYGAGIRTYSFTSCVNEGVITVTSPVGDIAYNGGLKDNLYLRNSETHGVGGFIGTVFNGTLTIGYNKPINDDSVGGGEGDGEPYYYFPSSSSGTVYAPYTNAPIVIMESCRNAANVLGSYNVGGLIGFNGGSTEVMNCGNTGAIDAVCEGSPTYRFNRRSRTYILTDVEKDLVGTKYDKMRVYIRRYANAGGLVGLSTSKGHVDLYTSYNSGTIHAWGNRAGGLIGADTEYKTVSSTPTKIFYCYNTGEVITGANKYTVFHGYNDDYTDRYDKDVDTSQDYTEHHSYMVDKGNAQVNIDDTDQTKQTVDHYQMSLRHEQNVDAGKQREGGSFGTTVGGIIGLTTNTNINNCYNLGTIICRGLAIFTFGSGVPGLSYTEFHARAGGLVGLVDSGSVTVSNSYSVGDIKVEARHAITGTFSLENTYTPLKQFRQTRPMYVAGIVGHDNANMYPDVNNCFSIKWQCHFLNEKGQWFRYHIEGYNDIVSGLTGSASTIIDNIWNGRIYSRKPTLGNNLSVTDEHSSSGYVVSNVSMLTAITNSNGIVTMPAGESYSHADSTQLNTSATKTHTVPSASNLNHANAGGQSDVRTVSKPYSDLKRGDVGAWIYMPGCLPQLAVFALDTQDGLAMTSVGYGRNTQGEFVQQPAGGEFNPYVIKDGIDLLGLSSLVTGGGYSAYIDFSNKYIGFANG
ncbi:MAG: hypothetical protein IKA59_03295, partial [Clostridia bacterium]|nr:hypothetical protein [Clostridia bacterium]